jgi:hypothetical protein
MAAEITNQTAVMVMTKDLDILIIAGDCWISIKNFTKGKFEILCTSKPTLKHSTMSFLPDASMARVKFNAAPSPIFEGISDHWLCALMMLMLGCNVYSPGMKAVQGMSALRMVQSIDWTSKDELFLSLSHKFMKKIGSQRNKWTLTLIQSSMNQPIKWVK